MRLNRIRTKFFWMFVLTILILTLLIQSFYYKEKFHIEMPTALTENPWGVNVHLGFNCTKPHAEEIFKSLKNLGISCIRVDVYWWYDNMFMQKDHCDYAMCLADKYNIDVLLVFPQLPNRTDGTFLKEYAEMFEYYCNRYDGKTPIVIEGDQTPRYPKIKYIEPCNEVEYHYKSQKLNVAQTYLLIKKAAQAIHNFDSTIKVVLPGMSSVHSDFLDSLLSFRDSGDHCLSDYCDIFNIHDYSWNTYDYNKSWKYWEKLYKKSGFSGKPIWITEYGKSIWESSKKTHADVLSRNSIVQLSKGVDRMFYYQFHSFGGNYFSSHSQIEEYYGMIEPSISNSYVSFMENDGVYKKAISIGDALEKVFIRENRDSVSVYTLNETICKKLKNKGVAIGGKGYTADSVVLYHQDNTSTILCHAPKRIGTGGKDFLCIDSGKFKDVDVSDMLVLYISNPKDTSNKWIGTIPLPAYNAYKTVSLILNVGCTRPVVKNRDNDVLIAAWQNTQSQKYYYALWTEKSDSQILKLSSRITNVKQIKNSESNIFDDREVKLTKTPVYLESDVELNFEGI